MTFNDLWKTLPIPDEYDAMVDPSMIAMSKNLKLAAVEGFTGSFVLAAILVRTLFGTLLSVMSSFAHDGPIK